MPEDDCRIPWRDPAHPRFRGQKIYDDDPDDDDDDSDDDCKKEKAGES